jgi:hypothetical protein
LGELRNELGLGLNHMGPLIRECLKNIYKGDLGGMMGKALDKGGRGCYGSSILGIRWRRIMVDN